MKRCSSCGAESVDGSVFCGECGAALDAHDTKTDSVELEKAVATTNASRGVAQATPGTVPGSPLSGALRVGADVPGPAAGKSVAPLAPPAGAPRGPAKPRHVEAGTVVDQKYRIERILGEGGMGVVYLARDVHTGVEVVLKAIRTELAHRADVRERTLAEGRAIARIDHVNVVHLKAVVVEGDSLWLVMQYVEGESLETKIAHSAVNHEPIPVPEVLAIFRQVLAGMGAVHHGGVIHRDLKPGNILIRERDGVAKVSDFGIAKGEEDARAGRGMTRGIIGSLWYMSPEQVTGRRDLDKRVDVYALGIMLFEMLTGNVPFDAENDYEIMRMHTTDPVPLVSATRSDVPRALDDVIQKACAKDREHRFASCEEFLQAIDRMTADAPTAAAGAPVRRAHAHTAARPATTAMDEPLPAPPKGRGWIAALLAIAALGALGAGLVFSGVIDLDALGMGTAKPARSVEPTRPTATAAGTQPMQPAQPSTASPTSTGSSREAGLAALEGRWVSENGRDFEAAAMGDSIEFRVVDPAQFEAQDYQPGEARFVIRALANEDATFAVEDRIRPLPPAGHAYSANARSTCLAIFTTAGSKPLRAVLEGGRLSVDFAKVEPSLSNFVTAKAKVTGCRGLDGLRAVKLPGVLRRK